MIQEYAARHPGNRIQIYDHASSDVIDAVLRREVEFGIAVAGAQHPELTTLPLLEDRFVLICREDHVLARRKRLAWRKLDGHPLVFVGSQSGNRPLLDAALATKLPALHVHYEVQRSSTAVGLVASGVAAAVVPHAADRKWRRCSELRTICGTRALTRGWARLHSISIVASASR